jgi:hypothetical protein
MNEQLDLFMKQTEEFTAWKALAGPYRDDEQWMLDNVLADLRRGGIKFLVRYTASGLEVWRDKVGWLGE